MSDSKIHPADQPVSNPASPGGNRGEPTAGNPSLSPLDGGRWRPVSPDELLRKPDPAGDSPQPDAAQVEVQLQRRQELEHKLKANPTDLDGFLELAAIYRQEQRPLEAKRLLTQAAQIFPDDETVRWQLEEAVLARSLQQLREVTDLARRLKTPEADRELERSRSDWACRRIEVCQARLERDPNHTAFRLALAEAKFDAELFEDAHTDAERLLELDEYAPQAHFIRGRCQVALGNDLEAMQEFRAVALRRAVVAPQPLKMASLKWLCDLAEKLGFDATRKQYRAHLQHLEAEMKTKDGRAAPGQAVKQDPRQAAKQDPGQAGFCPAVERCIAR